MSPFQLDHDQLEEKILEIAREYYEKGPGFAQEGVVLREIAERLGVQIGGPIVEQEQILLTCWHDLFRTGKLSWGYDIDNPDSPWFHFPHRANGKS
ncbi:MAG TPA: hypothetical protein VND64_10305 [Pirellulales bacterium]|nr:hypothetical protein [Pirellulales bacterium]